MKYAVKKKKEKNGQCIQCVSFKWPDICINGVQNKDEREKGERKLLEEIRIQMFQI